MLTLLAATFLISFGSKKCYVFSVKPHVNSFLWRIYGLQNWVVSTQNQLAHFIENPKLVSDFDSHRCHTEGMIPSQAAASNINSIKKDLYHSTLWTWDIGTIKCTNKRETPPKKRMGEKRKEKGKEREGGGKVRRE